VNNKEEYKM